MTGPGPLPLVHSQAHDQRACWVCAHRPVVWVEGLIIAEHDSLPLLLFEWRDARGRIHKDWVWEHQVYWARERAPRLPAGAPKPLQGLK